MKKRVSANWIVRFFALLMVVIVGVGRGLIGYAEENVRHLDYGIIEYTNEAGNLVREYDSSRVASAHARSQRDHLWVKEMLMVMGMREDIIDNISDEKMDKYAGNGKMYSVCTQESASMENNAESLTEDKILVASDTSEEGKYVSGSYSDDYIYVDHYVWISNDGNTIIPTTIAIWDRMPFYRLTDSLGSCTQNCAVRTETMEGFYSYDQSFVTNTGASSTNHIKTDFVAPEGGTNFTDETDFQLVTNGEYTGVGVTFDVPSNFSGSEINIWYSDFTVLLSYEASPIGAASGEELGVAASYCHTTWRFGMDVSLSINQDLSITPKFVVTCHKKDLFYPIILP